MGLVCEGATEGANYANIGNILNIGKSLNSANILNIGNSANIANSVNCRKTQTTATSLNSVYLVDNCNYTNHLQLYHLILNSVYQVDNSNRHKKGHNSNNLNCAPYSNDSGVVYIVLTSPPFSVSLPSFSDLWPLWPYRQGIVAFPLYFSGLLDYPA